jgi:oligosaccharide repeat unit polymerase
MILFEIALFLFMAAMLGIGYLNLSKERFDAFALYIYFFSLLFMGRHAMLMFGFDVPYPEYLFSFDVDSYRLLALFMVSIWLLFFLLIACLYRPGPNSFVMKLLPQAPEQPHLGVLAIPCVLLFLCSLAVVAYPISLYGFDFAVISYQIRIEKIFSGISFLQFLGPMGSYLIVAWIFAYLKLKRNTNSKASKLAIIGMLSMAFISTLSTLLMGERDQFAFFIVFVALSYSLFYKRVSTATLGILASLIITYMIIAGWMRMNLWGFNLEADSLARRITQGLNMDVYDKFILLLHTWQSQREPYRLGEDYILGFLGAIPRSLWPEKPEHVAPDIMLRHYFEPEMPSGWPFTPVGEFWLNFGWPGLVLGAILTGIIYVSIQQRYKNYTANPFSFMFMYLMVTRIFMLGYMTTSPMGYVLWIVPLILIFWIERRVATPIWLRLQERTLARRTS